MDKLTESYLKKIITESLSREIKELPYIGQDKRSPYLKSGKKKLSKYSPKIDDGTPFPEEEKKTGIPDYVIANPYLEENGEFIVVPLGCNELETFAEENKEWLESIGVKHGNLEVQLIRCKRTKDPHAELKKFFPSREQEPPKKAGIQEIIKRRFNKIVSKTLDNPDVQKMFNRVSIPVLNMKDTSPFGKGQTRKTKINQYSEYSNNKIEFELHSYDYYEGLKDFLDSVISRIRGTEGTHVADDKDYLPRQYNQDYPNWDATRKMEKEYRGKTPIQKKDKQGYDERNINAEVRLDLKITGELMDNSYLWNINLTSKVGKKLEEERGLRGGLLDSNLLEKSETVQLAPNLEFNNEYTVMHNKDIENGLINLMNDLKSEIGQINPKTMLKWATVRRNEVVRNELA